jgi:nucleoside-diphosphate-sugar epimerase
VTARRCLVLGGTGFIGSAVAAEAARRGWAVTAVGSKTAGAVVGQTFELLINANGNSRKYLAREDPAADFDLSVRTVTRSLHEIRSARYVFLSSAEVYDHPFDPAQNAEDVPIIETALSAYGFHKLLAEHLVRRYAPGWTILRLSGLVGPGLRKNALFDLLTGAPMRVHPDSAYQFIDTRVLARVLFDLLPDPAGIHHRIFNVGGHGVVTLREAAGWIGVSIPPGADALPRERCELNIERIARLAALPASTDAVRGFIDEWRRRRADG